MMKTIFLALLMVISGITSAISETWYVAKDGSGDYEIIQYAVTMAADGDVIEIGPGRYDDFTEYTFYADAFVQVEGKSLTFRGSGPEDTIIGPVDPHPRGAFGFVASDAASCRIENLSVENMSGGSGIGALSDILEVENFVFRGGASGSGDGVIFDGLAGGVIRSSQFFDTDHGVIVTTSNRGLLIENCSFSSFRTGVSINWSDTACTIRNCNFDGEERMLSAAISHAVGAQTIVESCTISGCVEFGIAAGSSGPITVRDCLINQFGGVGILLVSGHNAQIENNIIVSDVACVGIRGNGTPGATQVRNNHLLREGAGWYVKEWWGNYSNPGEVLDMEGNYWGTQDLEEIAAWVEDFNDNPEAQYYVDFDPIADSPVATKPMTFDGVKALFR